MAKKEPTKPEEVKTDPATETPTEETKQPEQPLETGGEHTPPEKAPKDEKTAKAPKAAKKPAPAKEAAPPPEKTLKAKSGSPCYGCSFWRGMACVGTCYRDLTSGQLGPKSCGGRKHG